MPLILGNGEGKPYIRFSPSVNSWEMSSTDGKREFTWDAPVVFDMHGIQLGWLSITAMGRDWQPWPSISQRTPQPQDGEYKIGFKVDVVSTKLFGGEPVREFSANGTGTLQFIQELYNACEHQEGWKDGMLPVVKITGSTPMKVGKGNTRIPTFEIVKMVPRPAELDGGSSIPSAPAPASKPAPAPAPASAPAAAEDDEF
jgi:hypothetical protein